MISCRLYMLWFIQLYQNTKFNLKFIFIYNYIDRKTWKWRICVYAWSMTNTLYTYQLVFEKIRTMYSTKFEGEIALLIQQQSTIVKMASMFANVGHRMLFSTLYLNRAMAFFCIFFYLLIKISLLFPLPFFSHIHQHLSLCLYKHGMQTQNK